LAGMSLILEACRLTAAASRLGRDLNRLGLPRGERRDLGENLSGGESCANRRGDAGGHRVTLNEEQSGLTRLVPVCQVCLIRRIESASGSRVGYPRALAGRRSVVLAE
ncbi:MAG: hypothetical protein ACR2OB_06075, partial [Solirubrobacteraceae bacterium]